MDGKLRKVLFLISLAHNLMFIVCERNSADIGNIVYAAVIFRSGESTPFTTYPTDPNKDHQWPQGYGQLTERGLQQVDQLGQYIQQRYCSSHGNTTNTEQCESNNNNKHVYSGTYPPFKTDLWNKFIQCQKVEIIEKDASENRAIKLSEECPRYNKLTKMFYESGSYMKLFCQRYNDIFEYIGNKTETTLIPCNHETNIVKLAVILDTLMAEKQNNLTLPSWTDQVLPEPINTILAKTAVPQVEDKNIRTLKAGPLLKVITTEMKQKINGTASTELHMFGASANTVVTFLRAFNVYNDIYPPPAASLSMELREKKNKFYVTLTYKNASAEPYLLPVPGCKTPCAFKKFGTIISPYVPNDWNAECNQDVDEAWPKYDPPIWQPTPNSPILVLDPFGLF